jgi:hypothetical protein
VVRRGLSLEIGRLYCRFPGSGGMAEWLKAHAWKACIRATVSWVRIPLPPPNQIEIVEEYIDDGNQLGRSPLSHPFSRNQSENESAACSSEAAAHLIATYSPRRVSTGSKEPGTCVPGSQFSLEEKVFIAPLPLRPWRGPVQFPNEAGRDRLHE